MPAVHIMMADLSQNSIPGSSSGSSCSSSHSSILDSDEENEQNSSGTMLKEDSLTSRQILKNSNCSNVANNNGSPVESELDTVTDEQMEIVNLKENDNVNQKQKQGQLGNARLPPKFSSFREMHDLTKLDNITLENVLECLRERYRCHQYYTYAGPILLSLNSCQRIPRASLIEDVARMSWYFVNKNERENNETTEPVAPHVYDIGRRCLKNLVNVGSDQIILISGETGAGKTTATQQLIKYLTENNSRNFGANFCSNLDKKIYFATVILESFGNAKTQANPNSSRFGRLVQLNYRKSSGKISGAEIQTYLLEKHRVAKYDFHCERSFHIFYYILYCLRNGTIEMPNNLAWKAMKLVTPDHMIQEALDCDDGEVQRLQNAVVAINMDDFSEVVSILFAIVSLLNIVFVPECDSSSEDEHFSSSLESPYKTEFTVADWNCARVAADLLCIKETELVDILIARKITAGNSHRHSIFRKPCERASECEERLHALTTFIYDRIFAYILDHLNANLTGDMAQNAEDLCSMSLLDLYGFENFNVNHLEQICINYANERLQQINISIVKTYYEQSIPPDEIMVPPTELIRIENELSSRIDELHLHVFAFLDEECLLKRLSEDKDVLERMRLNLNARKSKFIETGKPHETVQKFRVLHYATPVNYQLKGLIQKNKDHIPPEFQDILKSSTNAFIQNLFKVDLIRSRNASGQTPKSKSLHTISSNKNTRGKTILTRFKASVDELMSRLKIGENKEIHFIRCIRPNADLLAGSFSMSIVEKQLHTCGIADVVKIAGNGFPIRIQVTKFAKEFPKVTSYFSNGYVEAKRITLIFSKSTSVNSIKFGKTMVFMSEMCWKALKKTERFLIMHHTRIIQKAWKDHLKRKDELKMKSFVHSINTSREYSNTSTDVESEISNQTFESAGESSATSVIDRNVSWGSQKNTSCGSTTTLVSHVQRKIAIPPPPLFYGDRVASRFPVHTLPIKVYTKKMCLPFAEKAPRRLVANGIQDAFEDYGIIFRAT